MIKRNALAVVGQIFKKHHTAFSAAERDLLVNLEVDVQGLIERIYGDDGPVFDQHVQDAIDITRSPD